MRRTDAHHPPRYEKANCGDIRASAFLPRGWTHGPLPGSLGSQTLSLPFDQPTESLPLGSAAVPSLSQMGRSTRSSSAFEHNTIRPDFRRIVRRPQEGVVGHRPGGVRFVEETGLRSSWISFCRSSSVQSGSSDGVMSSAMIREGLSSPRVVPFETRAASSLAKSSKIGILASAARRAFHPVDQRTS